MKNFDYSDTVQSNTGTMPEQETLRLLPSCATRQYLTCSVSVVSDPSNPGVHKYKAQCFPRQLNFVWLCLIFTVPLFQSFSSHTKMCISSHAPSRKHLITVRVTGHSSTVSPQCGTCFVSLLWQRNLEVTPGFLENL